MKIINPKELKKLKQESPSLFKKMLFKSSIVGGSVALIVIAVAPIVEENALFFSLLAGAVVFVTTGNTLMQTDEKEK